MNIDQQSPAEQEDEPPRRWDQWPHCPDCGRRRQAICDSCEFPGDDFPLADYLEPVEVSPLGSFEQGEFRQSAASDSTLRILLMCPRCDEAFTPRFYRLCQWCGHEFESGREPENSLAEPLDARVMWTLFGLAVLAVAGVGYFWWVTS